MTGALLPAALLLAAAGGAPLPDCKIAPGWTQDGEARAFEPDDLFDYMDGNAEGYLVYRFVRMDGITCRSGESTIVIDVSETANPDFAYGLFATNRDPRRALAPLGMVGQQLPDRTTFAKDKYYVELAVHSQADAGAAVLALARDVERRIEGRTTLPDALAFFPDEGLTAGSVRLVPESVLGLRLLRQGWIAQYDLGKAFVVTEASPEAAAEVMAKLRARIGETSAVSLGDEAFTGKDRYLGGLYVFRKGWNVAGLANVKDGVDPAPLARRLSEKLP